MTIIRFIIDPSPWSSPKKVPIILWSNFPAENTQIDACSSGMNPT